MNDRYQPSYFSTLSDLLNSEDDGQPSSLSDFVRPFDGGSIPLSSLAAALSTLPPRSALAGGVSDLFPSAPPPPSLPTRNALTGGVSDLFSALAGNALTGAASDLLLPSPPPPPYPARNTLTGAAASDLFPSTPKPSATSNALAAAVRRKVYFAFDFDDVIRVNNVRHVGKIGPREIPRTFYDRSIWESRDINTDDGLKDLMRRGVQYSSAVCVLIGTKTYLSRWVKYEIARAVVDERGLLAVHLNGINHHQRKTPDQRGINPLYFMGIFHAPNGSFYLYEQHLRVMDAATAQLGFEWRPYEDYVAPVPLPRYIPQIGIGYVAPLSIYTHEYDMVTDQGFQNIGAWIDTAAVQVGR